MGVDPDAFVRTRPYDPDGPVLAVGRLVPKKGFLHLVRATTRATIIVGEGPQRSELEAAIGDRPVHLAGARSPREIRELLQQASVLAAPCVVAPDGDRDSMPVVVKEAMAMEVPVVASNEVGLPEIVRPPFGALVPPGDEAALRSALQDPPRDGRAGREYVIEHANVVTEAAKLSALWR
jgi:glycosyltransferase involved in cell wall biosynthesis